MTLYHGPDKVIQKPDLLHSHNFTNLGKGFYLTPCFEDAVKWCEKYDHYKMDAVISSYEFDETQVSQLKVLKLECYCEDWLDSILACRSGKEETEHDIVIGGVANDKVFNTVELFFDGLIDKKEAIKRLRFEKPKL